MIRFEDDETSAGGSFVRPLAVRSDGLFGISTAAELRGAWAGVQSLRRLLRLAQLPRVAQPAREHEAALLLMSKIFVLALLVACSGETTTIDDAGGNDASFDGIPVVCGVIVAQGDLCIHCATAPGTSNTCHGVCESTTSPTAQCAGSDPSATACGDIACGSGCSCFNAKDGVCQCEK